MPPALRELRSPVTENFSLTRGGLLHRLELKLIQPPRRALAAVLLTWLPLLVLSVVEGLAYGDQVRIPFVRDFAVNARFLIAVPLLILSETGIDYRLRIAVNHFLNSGLVTEADVPSYEAVIGKLTRLRDRILPEILILAAACFMVSPMRNPDVLTQGISTWHQAPADSGQAMSYAGWWFGLVSAPVFRFLLFRWLWRMFLWAAFLWRVSRLNLVLMPTHPDEAAGLGFLSAAQVRFGAIAFAISAVMAGQLGNALTYEGATLNGLKFIVAGYLALIIALLATPLLLLVPTLYRVKKRGLLEYGALASFYTRTFDAKWVHGRPPQGESLLGSSDIQSLADLNNSFAVVREMRLAPIDKSTLLDLALATALPLVPALLLATPAEDLIRTILKLLA